MKKLKKNYLVLSIVGANHVGAATTITNLCLSCDTHLMDSRMTKMGNEFIISALISGNWSGIAKLEASLPNLKRDLGVDYICKRTELTTSNDNVIQYTVQITTIDKPSIAHTLCKFFKERNINIDDITSETYVASRTNTNMFTMSMTVNIPDNIHIMNLREQFMTYCEDKNLDAILLEPQKY